MQTDLKSALSDEAFMQLLDEISKTRPLHTVSGGICEPDRRQAIERLVALRHQLAAE